MMDETALKPDAHSCLSVDRGHTLCDTLFAPSLLSMKTLLTNETMDGIGPVWDPKTPCMTGKNDKNGTVLILFSAQCHWSTESMKGRFSHKKEAHPIEYI